MEVVSAAGQALLDLTGALMTIERQPLLRIEAQKATVDQTITAQRGIGSKLSTLRRLAADFAQIGSLSPLRSFRTTGDPTGFRVSAGDTATPGIHTVRVLGLASRQSLASTAVAADETTLAKGLGAEGGTFRFTVGVGATTEEIAIQVDPEADNAAVLRAVASAVGTQSDLMTASVVRVGDGQLKLLVQSQGQGFAGQITNLNDIEGGLFSQLGIGGGLDEDGHLRGTVQTAADARLEIDGLEIQSSTNRLENVLNGVNLNLTSIPDGPEAFEVVRDEDKILEEIQSFVDGYNSTLDEIRQLTRPSDENGTGRGILAGGSTFRSLRTGLRQILTGPLEVGGVRRSLASLGIEADREGKLSVKESAVRTSLQGDPEMVEELIGGETGVAARLETFLDAYSRSGGIVDQQIAASETRRDLYTSRIAALEETLEKREESLLQRLAQLQSTIGILTSQQNYLAGQLGQQSILG